MKTPAMWSWRLAARPCGGCGTTALVYLCNACDAPTCASCGQRDGLGILCQRVHLDESAGLKARALALRDELLQAAGQPRSAA